MIDARVADQTRLSPPIMVGTSSIAACASVLDTTRISQKLRATAAHRPVCVGVVRPAPKPKCDRGFPSVICDAWMSAMIVVPIRIAATRCDQRARSGHSTGIHSSTRVARNCVTPNAASGDHSSVIQLHASHASRHSIHP